MSGSGPRKTKAGSVRSERTDAAAKIAVDDRFPVIGIGASAGGLEPCKKFVAALPMPSGMAFILVQHLDPTQESMMVELLRVHTPIAIRLAQDGTVIERDHVYVIPPGVSLSVSQGMLRLTQPVERHGARLPFDHLLRSMARDCGRRAVCVILSGGGADGSLGLKAVKDAGGLVIVQDPDEAAHDGMPRSAIATGAVDMVLAVAQIPMALSGYRRRMEFAADRQDRGGGKPARDRFSEIIELLRVKSAHDFRLYKQGTLERRIERRMAMAAIGPGDLEKYLAILQSDPLEIDLLAKDLLIHVTSFFRNPEVFEILAATTIPALIGDVAPDRPLRVWIAGCSTGEETYSLAMLFHEKIAEAKTGIKLQIFASDVDADAIAIARTGLYPESVAAGISPARLARFFSREGDAYRVSADLRASIVFTVQDLLADPPFSRVDMVSCRNLLIYLGPEAQRKVISLFHFAIRDGGILLLGSAETIGKPDGRFETIGEQERIYRNIGRKRVPEFAIPKRRGEPAGGPMQSTATLDPLRPASLGELCRSTLLETYAPAAVVVDRKNECLFLFGQTDDYLKAASGHAVHDVLAMARDGVRTKLRSAMRRARSEGNHVIVTGGRMVRDGVPRWFSVAVQPIRFGSDEMTLICFLDEQQPMGRLGPSRARGNRHSDDLELELEAMRKELDTAIRSHETFGEEQKAVNEEALSVNEEYQSTNEELISSKEELQSLNEELSALNGQLQETLERQRTTSNDLQNVLFSTDVATLFLDVDLRIRFFTPTVKALFSLIPSDVGRPLSDFNPQAVDDDLSTDAHQVLRGMASIKKEIEAPGGIWFSRRIMPYCTEGDVEGVVITFFDITERKHAAKALDQAKEQAERANAAKSRFLAAASHDLRQPLQTLTLLQSLMVKTIDRDQSAKLIARSEEALAAMSTMLNTLLDINQIEAGAVSAAIVGFPVDRMLDVLREEFIYLAQAQGLDLRVVPCGLSILTDPHLLEQMIRNLLSNALKYTRQGKVLLGCRRRRDTLSIEIWDTGIGIPDGELSAIFEEYHQVGNLARDRSLGLGLGLSIVKRLGDLLGHHVHVRSTHGKGSVFAVEAPLAAATSQAVPAASHSGQRQGTPRTGTVLIVEDDKPLRELLQLYLQGEGHRAVAVADGAAAIDLVSRGAVIPDLILADYNLPGGMDGLVVAARLRTALRRPIPTVILTGDVSTDALRAIAGAECLHLNKPVGPEDLSTAIQGLLPPNRPGGLRQASPSATSPFETMTPVIFVVDDDDNVRAAIRCVLEDGGRTVADFATGEAFLEAYRPTREACILIDARLPGIDGIELLKRLKTAGHRLPAIMITGDGDIGLAVRAMKAGASDFIEKPIERAALLAAVDRALEPAEAANKMTARAATAADHVAGLTVRQRQVMDLVLAGHPSKNIAADLGISQRTVENHRATIMRKTGSKSLPALARLSFAAAWTAGDKEA